MFKGLVFPILLHMSRFDSGEKNRRQDFDQTSRTIRGVLRLGLQGVDKSGLIFPRVIDAYKFCKNRNSIRT